MELRNYQRDAIAQIKSAWREHDNVLLQLPTGAGKTVLFCALIDEYNTYNRASCVLVHRRELVFQVSCTLARYGVQHRVIVPRSAIAEIVKLHMQAVGRSFYSPSARVGVASVQTLIRRGDVLRDWLDDVQLWVQDECHHVAGRGIFRQALDMLPAAHGLGVTATPARADGKGLGSDNDGVFDTLITGPSIRELISTGYLADYRLFMPPNNLDLSAVAVSQSTGDYVQPQLRFAVNNSTITGDAVDHYQRHTPGRSALAFVVDIAAAEALTESFIAAGVPAATANHKTPDAARLKILNQFRRGALRVLVSVDLLNEGLDVPGADVAILVRPTKSYAVHAQQIGRVLRPNPDDRRSVILDLVGNMMLHGIPDTAQNWTLDRRPRGAKKSKPIALVKMCSSCVGAYERRLTCCPYCGYTEPITNRSAPEFVDGDLTELAPDVLADLRAKIARVEMSRGAKLMDLFDRRVPQVGHSRQLRLHDERQTAHGKLRTAIDTWGESARRAGRSDAESYRLFYLQYGVDVLTAQTFSAADMLALSERICDE